MAIWKKIMIFSLGGTAYQGLELIWRGRTHGSMFLAGGLCFLLVGHLNRVRPRLPRLLRALVGALIITMVELAVGLTVNLDHRVWDYRSQPGNFLGQICPQFTLIWIPVAYLAGWLYDFLEEKITGRLSRPVTVCPKACHPERSEGSASHGLSEFQILRSLRRPQNDRFF